MVAGLVGFVALPTGERGRTLEAALCLLFVRLIFGVLPFARALQLLRIVPGEARMGRIAAVEAEAVGRAIARAARHVPFRAPVCNKPSLPS